MIVSKKNVTTYVCAVLLMLLGLLTMGGFWVPGLRDRHKEIGRKLEMFEASQVLLAEKNSLERSFAEKKDFYQHEIKSQEECQNEWLKDILTYAQSQSISIEKLEPGGIKDSVDGKELIVFVSFKGSIQKVVEFFYHLMDSRSLIRVDSFSIRQQEDSSKFSFEFVLGRFLQ